MAIGRAFASDVALPPFGLLPLHLLRTVKADDKLSHAIDITGGHGIEQGFRHANLRQDEMMGKSVLLQSFWKSVL